MLVRVFVFLILVWPTLAFGYEKVALVIGNASYVNEAPLANPLNDMNDVANALSRHGFEVMTLPDADIDQMDQALGEFERLASQADIAMVYYAGHGIEIDGENYLLPTSASLESKWAARREAISAREVLQRMSGTRVLKMLVLDACRNNPFAARVYGDRSAGNRGLSRIIEGEQTFIAYAAAEGATTPDGNPGGNSPYTAAFLEALDGPPRDVNKLFRTVRAKLRETVPDADPFTYEALPDVDIIINPASASPSVEENQLPVVKEATLDRTIARDFAIAKEFNTRLAWESFLKEYEHVGGFHVAMARQALSTQETNVLKDQEEPNQPIEVLIPDNTNCDRLAANPDNPLSTVDGVPLPQMRAENAISACLVAVESFPDEPRFEYQLGRSYQAASDYFQANQHYKAAADLDYAPAITTLANNYRLGNGAPKDADRAVELLRQAEELEYAPALNLLGRMYRDGEDVFLDDREAVRLFRQASNMGHADSTRLLGGMYQTGRGVSQDHQEALRLYRQAAEADLGAAFYNLGLVYQYGLGVQENAREAARMYQSGVARGSLSSFDALGSLYLEGTGVPKDYPRAFSLFQRSVELGNTASMVKLGRMYNEGLGTPRNPSKAQRYFTTAAREGQTAAMLSLANMFDTSQPNQAAHWLFQALTLGHEPTRRSLINNHRSWSHDTKAQVQRLLKRDSCYSGTIDGVFGQQSFRAINACFKTKV